MPWNEKYAGFENDPDVTNAESIALKSSRDAEPADPRFDDSSESSGAPSHGSVAAHSFDLEYSLEELEAELEARRTAHADRLRSRRRNVVQALARIEKEIENETEREALAETSRQAAEAARRATPRNLTQRIDPVVEAALLPRAGMPSTKPFPTAQAEVKPRPPALPDTETDAESEPAKATRRSRPLAPLILKALAANHPSPLTAAQLAFELRASAQGENLEATIARVLGRMVLAGNVTATQEGGGHYLTPQGMKRAGAG